jgi:uncharacterized protein YjbI with pentapeptide repeats
MHLDGLPGQDEVETDLGGAGRDLRGVAVRHMRVPHADLVATELSGASLRGANLEEADLWHANLAGADIAQANLNGAMLQGANLIAARLTGADLTGAHLWQVNLTRAVLRAANLTAVTLWRADLRGAELGWTDLTGANLWAADLSGASLREANLTNAYIHEAVVKRCDLRGITYDLNHEALRDGSEGIVRSWTNRMLNWELVHKFTVFPLFGISLGALLLSVVAVNAIGVINRTELLTGLVYPIPMPHRIELLLFGSVLLLVGATILKLACPSTVQACTESQWVEQHGRPRLIYLRAKWSRGWLQVLILILTGAGVLAGAFVIAEQVLLAVMRLVRAQGSSSISP